MSKNVDWAHTTKACLKQAGEKAPDLVQVLRDGKNSTDIGEDDDLYDSAARVIYSQVTKLFLRSLRKELEALAGVYAIGVILNSKTEALREEILSRLLRSKPRKGNSTFLSILNATIELPEKGSDRTTAQKRISMQAAAMCLADRLGWTPESFVKNLKRHAGGLDALARREIEFRSTRESFGIENENVESPEPPPVVWPGHYHESSSITRKEKRAIRSQRAASFAAGRRRKEAERALVASCKLKTGGALRKVTKDPWEGVMWFRAEPEAGTIIPTAVRLLGARDPLPGETKELLDQLAEAWGEAS